MHRVPGDYQSEIYLRTLEIKDDASGPASAAKTPPRPKPKPRPHLGQPMVDATGKSYPAMPVAEPPELHESNAFVASFVDRISDEWGKAMRKESPDWHPEIEVHFIFSVDAEKGTVAIESQSSPANPAGLERFRKLLESLAPVTLPDSLRAICGKELHFELSYKTTKEPAAASH